MLQLDDVQLYDLSEAGPLLFKDPARLTRGRPMSFIVHGLEPLRRRRSGRYRNLSRGSAMGTETAGALGKALATQFEFTFNVLQQNTAGVDHAGSLQAPQAAGNSMNWVGGHLVGARCGLLELLGADPVWDEKKRARYGRGSLPITPEDAQPWDEIQAALATSQERLRAAFAALAPERLLAPLPEDQNPFRVDNLAEYIGTYAFHEAYHVGQLGLIRRTYGMDGAIS